MMRFVWGIAGRGSGGGGGKLGFASFAPGGGRIIALVLAVAMLLAVTAGCRSNDADGGNGGGGLGGSGVGAGANSGGAGGSGETADALSEYVYLPHFVSLPSEIGYGGYNSVYCDGRIYYATVSYDEQDTDSLYSFSATPKLYSTSYDGSDLTLLDAYTPPFERPRDMSGAVNVSAITFDNDGFLWLFETWTYRQLDLPDDFDAESEHNIFDYVVAETSGHVIRKLDTTGKALLSIDMSGFAEQVSFSSVDAFAVFGENILLSFDNAPKVFVLDINGELRREFNAKYSPGSFAETQGGAVALLPSAYYGSSFDNPQISLETFDLSTMEAGEEIEIAWLGG